jgi:hypothetical protein
MNLLAKVLCFGLPGATECHSTPCSWLQPSVVLNAHALLLSETIERRQEEDEWLRTKPNPGAAA